MTDGLNEEGARYTYTSKKGKVSWQWCIFEQMVIDLLFEFYPLYSVSQTLMLYREVRISLFRIQHVTDDVEHKTPYKDVYLLAFHLRSPSF